MNHITTTPKTCEAAAGMILGGRLTVAAFRLGWGVLVGLSLVLFVLSVPARYEELAELALAGVFEVTLVTVQHVLLVLTHVEDSRLAYFATAMVMAALFELLKRRIDALVERLFFRQGEGDGGFPGGPAKGPAESSP